MFIGCRGTVRAGPTVRGSGSRDASEARNVTPVACRAGARFGLSAGISGSERSPECSPVTSSRLSTVTFFERAQSRFWVISDVISACDAYCTVPVDGWVAQRHGTTLTSLTQPRYGWL